MNTAIKVLIAEVVGRQVAHSLPSASAGSKNPSGDYVLPKRTPEEQMEKNKAVIEWLDKWAEEGDEEELRETF